MATVSDAFGGGGGGTDGALNRRLQRPPGVAALCLGGGLGGRGVMLPSSSLLYGSRQNGKSLQPGANRRAAGGN